jgi:hypothetical protein
MKDIEPDITSAWKRFRITLIVIFILITSAFFFLHWLGGKKSVKSGLESNEDAVNCKIIESKKDIALIKKDDRYFIQKTNEYTLRTVQFPKNKTINSISLSNKGDYLATILSSSSSSSIEIISIIEKVPFKQKIHELSIDSAKLDSVAIEKMSKEVSICGWSELEWSPNDSLLAFFVQDEDDNHVFSIAYDIKLGKVIWVEPYEERYANRDLAWLNNKMILITRFDKGINEVESISK